MGLTNGLNQGINSVIMKINLEDAITIDSMSDELTRLQIENERLQLDLNELKNTNEFLISATWREREMKKQLRETLNELEATKLLMEIHNAQISDSINYASRIQDAIIPKHKDLKSNFTDAFVYHEAKNVVSGDFPWFFENSESTYIAAVDCTGHGVPGAMMSLIGYLLLNNLANHGITDPAKILTHLHWDIVKTLKQLDGSQSIDGMDVALCRIDQQKKELKFSGAHRPLYLIRQGELMAYQGDRFPIGGIHYKGRNTFTDCSIQIEEGDMIYLFSDGLTDQFGGPQERKLGTKRFQQLLLQNAHLPMDEQHTMIRHSFEYWKAEHKQTDDLLLIGIQL